MSESNSSLFQEKGDNSKEGWSPFNTKFPAEITPQNSIFPTDYSFPPRSSPATTPSATSTWSSSNFFNDIASVPMLPEVSESPFYREQRSMSYSFGHNDFYNINQQHQFMFDKNLSTIMQEEDDNEAEGEEEDDDEIDLESYYKRTRSKSSAAIMDIWSPSHHVQTDVEDAKWLAAQHKNTRRSSLIPPSTTSSTIAMPPQRRFSLAPPSLIESSNYYNSSSSNTNIANAIPSSSYLNQRRHSLAGPTLNMKTNTIPTANTTANSSIMMDTILELESLSIREHTNQPSTTRLEDTYMMKIDDMGKGTRLDSDTLKNAIFYVVEFKGGRSDLFYYNSNNRDYFKKNDLVIVEGDRGRDLGKISKKDISREHLETYYARLKKNVNYNDDPTNSRDDNHKTHYMLNEIYIKSIFRLAETNEITLLMAKGQDEAKALMVCQSKIKQKKLSMQVVDAEYQWDRRKLTFYFIAEKRVDFRELVRELFKLYKTRIWMCAVTSITVLE